MFLTGDNNINVPVKTTSPEYVISNAVTIDKFA